MPLTPQQLYAAAIEQFLASGLPHSFKGFSTDFGNVGTDGSAVVEKMQSESATKKPLIHHRVVISTLDNYCKKYFGVTSSDLLREEILPLKFWASTPNQKLLGFTKGRIFCDTIGNLTKVPSFIINNSI
jgi:hypothetical protein